jgi:o-succinylbenzoate synthase
VELVELQIHRFRIPLRAPFRGHSFREGQLWSGPVGWGECSPLPGYPGSDPDRSLDAAHEAAFEDWPKPVRDRVPVHVTVPALDPEAAAVLVRSSGCRAAKVKVAEGDDEARLEAVRDALGPSGRLTVDANGAWSVDEARHWMRTLDRYGVEMVEQPVETMEEMAELRRRIDLPIAADELVTSPEAARRIADLEAADVLVVKVQSLGGVRPAIWAVEAAGVPAIVSSMLETSVGVAAGLALAATLPELPFPCGLGTVSLLEADVVAEPLLPVSGELSVRRPEVDLDLLARYEIDPPSLFGFRP